MLQRFCQVLDELDVLLLQQEHAEVGLVMQLIPDGVNQWVQCPKGLPYSSYVEVETAPIAIRPPQGTSPPKVRSPPE